MLNVGNTDMDAESERHDSEETSSQHLDTNVKEPFPLIQESSYLQGTNQDIEPKDSTYTIRTTLTMKPKFSYPMTSIEACRVILGKH
jgi:hypothetical protein